MKMHYDIWWLGCGGELQLMTYQCLDTACVGVWLWGWGRVGDLPMSGCRLCWGLAAGVRYSWWLTNAWVPHVVGLAAGWGAVGDLPVSGCRTWRVWLRGEVQLVTYQYLDAACVGVWLRGWGTIGDLPVSGCRMCWGLAAGVRCGWWLTYQCLDAPVLRSGCRGKVQLVTYHSLDAACVRVWLRGWGRVADLPVSGCRMCWGLAAGVRCSWWLTYQCLDAACVRVWLWGWGKVTDLPVSGYRMCWGLAPGVRYSWWLTYQCLDAARVEVWLRGRDAVGDWLTSIWMPHVLGSGCGGEMQLVTYQSLDAARVGVWLQGWGTVCALAEDFRHMLNSLVDAIQRVEFIFHGTVVVTTQALYLQTETTKRALIGSLSVNGIDMHFSWTKYFQIWCL